MAPYVGSSDIASNPKLRRAVYLSMPLRQHTDAYILTFGRYWGAASLDLWRPPGRCGHPE